MSSKVNGGRIEVICGGMFSGKTEELVRRLKRAQIAKQKTQVFKSAIDVRYNINHIQSHDSNKLPSTLITNPFDILDEVEYDTLVIGIDEVQFFDSRIVEVVQRLADEGKRVIIAGLDLDSQSQPFGSMPELLCIAESVTKLSAICTSCGEAASRSYRTSNNNALVLVGEKESYEARCRTCYTKGMEEK